MQDMIDYDKLASAIAEKLRSMPAHDEVIWDSEECAQYFKVSRQHFTDRISKTFGFPAGVPLPNGTGKRAEKRWYASEVQDWWRKRKPKKVS